MSRADRPKCAPAKDAGLPSSYGKSYLALLEIEPGFVHAIWDVTPHDARRAAARLDVRQSDAVWVLRFYTSECSRGTTFDVEIEPTPRNWYIRFAPDQRALLAEIGIRSSSDFVPICRSNAIGSPEPGHGNPPECLAAAEGKAEPAPRDCDVVRANAGLASNQSPEPERRSGSPAARSETPEFATRNPQPVSSFGWGTGAGAREGA